MTRQLRPRVAVVAVHGVGGPPPASTATAVAELLVQHAPSGVRYGGFVEERLTLPTSPVGLGQNDDKTRSDAAAGRPTRGGRVRAAFAHATEYDRTRIAGGCAPSGDPVADVAFMREQLRRYQSDRQPYSTVRLAGERIDERTGETTLVDVYEMYWADLSRVGSGAVRVLGALYQLVLHLSHLGRKALDIGVACAPATSDGSHRPALAKAWRHYAGAHAWAVRIFTLCVPVATLLMLTAPILFIPAAVPSDWRLAVGLLVLLLLVAVALGTALFYAGQRELGAGTFLAGLGALAAVAASLYLRPPGSPVALGGGLLVVDCAVVALCAYTLSIRAYEASRPGAIAWGSAILILVLVLTVWRWRLTSATEIAERARQGALIAFEWSWVVLIVCWLVLWAFVAAAALLRCAVTRLTPRGGEQARLSRAAWTARVTLGLSVGFFTLAGLVGYWSLVAIAWRYRDRFDLFPAMPFPVVLGFLVPSAIGDGRGLFNALIVESGTSALPLVLAGGVVALLLVSWFVVLVGVTNVSVPRPEWRHGEALGNWMTQGFRWLRRAGNVFAFSVLGLIMVGGVIDVLRHRGLWHVCWLDGWLTPHLTEVIISRLSYAVLASAVTVASVQLRLALLASRVRPAVGIALDVDNYLRESPVTGTPRARMAERFASLLRHINHHVRGTDLPPYDRVIIVAHSQGTVLSADLLRFLHAQGISEVGVTPERYRLMTMGSPLRQLYAANFPHLYRWVDSSDDEAAVPPRRRDIGTLTPSPEALHVARWVSLYTTGDYVGRCLWRRDDTPEAWKRENVEEAADTGDRRERCLGAGTHTHYWTSPDVAAELDLLISAAPSALHGFAAARSPVGPETTRV